MHTVFIQTRLGGDSQPDPCHPARRNFTVTACGIRRYPPPLAIATDSRDVQIMASPAGPANGAADADPKPVGADAETEVETGHSAPALSKAASKPESLKQASKQPASESDSDDEPIGLKFGGNKAGTAFK